MTTKITNLNITGNQITIGYTPAPTPAPPAPTPVPTPTIKPKGTLSGAAYDTATDTSNTEGNKGIDSKTFRSVGYFGIGFGGNIGDKGRISQNYSLADIDLSLYTHINIAFLAIADDGHLTIPNSFASQGTTATSSLPPWLNDINTTYMLANTSDRNMSAVDYVYAVFKELRNQVSGNTTNNMDTPVKLMATIGGWNISNNKGEGTQNYATNLYNIADGASDTPGVSTNKSIYDNFISNITQLFTDQSIDGVDIDWEYPGRPPLISQCEDDKGNIYPCKVNEPTKIGPCTDEPCSSFHYVVGDEGCDPASTQAQYRLPSSYTTDPSTNPGEPPTPVPRMLVLYSNLLTGIKKIIISSKPSGELSIALAGAPNGLSWYINTAVTLLKDSIIDFANVMAYDYNGFWGSGQVSGFLANFTNIDTIDSCKIPQTAQDTCLSYKCKTAYKPQGDCNICKNDEYCVKVSPASPYSCKKSTASSASDICGKRSAEECAVSTDLCTNPLSTKLDFTNNNGEWTSKTSDKCPVILYNQLGNNDRNNTLTTNLFGTADKPLWYSDTESVNAKQASGKWSPLITLSIKTILRALTTAYNIDPHKLVIGLPYYGRTFQNGKSDSKPIDTIDIPAFTTGSFGLYQPYEYGSAYSFSDIYEKYYNESISDCVKTIRLTNDVIDESGETKKGYTEDIVYASEKSDMLSHITTDMTEEMISYNSIDSIKHKVKYLKENDFGGYMCWHMLSDYYADATPAQPASNI